MRNREGLAIVRCPVGDQDVLCRTMKATLRILMAALAVSLFATRPSYAQIGGSGSIQGTVVDQSGAAIPGATVTAMNVATGVATVRVTTEAGVYVLSTL